MSRDCISFTTPMVQARRAGRKNLTRRIMNPQPIAFEVDPQHSFESIVAGGYMACSGYDEPPPGYRRQRWWRFDDRTNGILEYTREGKRGTTAQIRNAAQWHRQKDSKWAEREVVTLCPYAVGSIVNVKEAAWIWCEKVPDGLTPKKRPKFRYIPQMEVAPSYVADDPKKPLPKFTSLSRPKGSREFVWRLKIPRYLPAWAVRDKIEIVSVRVERLQDITEADAKAEGVQYGDGGYWNYIAGETYQGMTAIESFRTLWEFINGAGSWEANPWVWRIEFKDA